MVFTAQKLTSKCPSLHSPQEKKDWKFYDLMGQGGQGWIQLVQAVLALARVAWVHWAFIFPPVKWEVVSLQLHSPLCAQQPPTQGGVSPLGGSRLLPGFLLACLCLCWSRCLKLPSC